MKSIFTLVTVLSFISFNYSQSNSIFGYLNSDEENPCNLNSMVAGDNDHLYAIGYELGTNQSTLIKANQNGEIIWQKKVLPFGPDNPIQMVQVRYFNNHLYALGVSLQMGDQLTYPLVKIDINGNLVWTRMLRTVDPEAYHLPSIEFSPSGEIMVSSSTFGRVELFSLNENGSTNWIKSFTTDSTNWKNPNFDITICDDGDVIGSCKAGSDMCFYRMDPNGNLEWSKRFLENNNSYTHIKSVRTVSSNLFIVCGFRVPDIDIFEPRGFYALMDGSGNFTSFNIINELSEVKNAFLLDNNNFLLEGVTLDNQYALIEINTTGTVINSFRTSSSPSAPQAYESVVSINGTLFIGDGGYVQKLNDISSTDCFNYESTTFTYTGEDPGTMPSSGYFYFHPAAGNINHGNLAVLEPGNLHQAYGCALTMSVDPASESNIAVYPTLLTNNDVIFIEHELTGNVQYQIMDINGKMITQNELTNSSVSIDAMSAGMYVLQLSNNGSAVYHSKFVVK